jgi:YggT family protein
MPFEPALNEQERWARSLADMTAGTEMALYLIQNLGALVLTLIVLRGMLHASRANFYNPISQLIVKITNPVLAPLRGVLPAKGRIDWAILVMAVLIQILILLGIAWVLEEQWSLPNPLTLVGWGIIGVLGLLTNLTFFVLIAMIIVSWVAAGSRHPAIELIGQIAEPIMAPFRALLPNMGGIDFSPILLFITINIVQIGLRHAAVALSLPPNLVVGL